MGSLRYKPGVQIDRLDVGGALILAALQRTVFNLRFDLVVTSVTDGEHSGPRDPHKLGKAVDVRSHDLSWAAKDSVLKLVMGYLAEFTEQLMGKARGSIELETTSDGLATPLFFGFLENRGGPNEHFHLQVRKGREVLAHQEALNA